MDTPPDWLEQFSAYAPASVNCTYYNGHAYYPMQILQGGSRITTVVIKSDRTIRKAHFEAPNDERGAGIWRLDDGMIIGDKPQPNQYATWQWDAVKAYLTKSARTRPLQQIVGDIHDYLKRTIWLPQSENYCLLAFIAVLTYVQEAFDSVPLLLLNGRAGSGKTRLAQALASISFNGVITSCLTSAAAIARLINESRGFVVIDDLELSQKYRRDQALFSDLVQSLKLAYNRSTALKSYTNTRTGRVSCLNFYGIKCITNTSDVDSILKSRCFTITTEKMPVYAMKAYQDQLPGDPETLTALRQELHIWAFENISKIHDLYQRVMPSRTDRQNEIAAPLRILAQYAGDAKWIDRLEGALAIHAGEATNRPHPLVHVEPDEILEAAVHQLIIEGYRYFNASHLVNEIKYLGDNRISAKAAGVYLKKITHVDRQLRKRLPGCKKLVRLYPIRKLAIMRAKKYARRHQFEMHPVKHELFCRECQSCKYKFLDCTMHKQVSSVK